MVPAHIFTWRELNETPPRNTRLRRVCATRVCVNPDHWVVVPTEDRFWAFVQRGDGCWMWTGNTTDGYGRFSVKIGGRRKLTLAHRMSYELHVGPIPDGMDVLHHCDNPPCVRPDHLFLGDDASNCADKIAKGRMPVGERCVRAKLTEAEVRTIRMSRRDALSLANLHGVTRSTIYDIRRRKTWTHL